MDLSHVGFEGGMLFYLVLDFVNTQVVGQDYTTFLRPLAAYSKSSLSFFELSLFFLPDGRASLFFLPDGRASLFFLPDGRSSPWRLLAGIFLG